MRLSDSSMTRLILPACLVASCLATRTPAQTPAPSASAFRGDAQHTGVFDAPGVPRLTGMVWTFEVGGRAGAPPAVADDVFCVGRSVYPGLVAVDARTGKKLWEFASGNYTGSPVIDNGLVFAPYGNGGKEVDGFRGGFRAIDLKTGKEKWNRQTVAGTERSSPTVHADIVYLVSVDAVLWALDARTGQEKWRFRFIEEGSADVVTSAAFDNGTIYFGAQGWYMGRGGPYLYAVDADTGRQKWKVGIPSAPGQPTANRSLTVGVLDAPAVSEGTIYLASDSKKFYAIDARTGAVKWSFEAGGYVTSPAVGDSLVFFGSNDKFLHALDKRTGREKWKIATEGMGVSVPSLARGVVYFGGGATPSTGLGNYIYAADADTGEVKWKFETLQPSPGVPNMARWEISAPTIVGDSVYFTCWTKGYRLR